MKLIDLQNLAGFAANIFPSCVIGGGAVRDTFLGAPVKDIDLFVDTRDTYEVAYRKQVHLLTTFLGGTAVVAREASVESQYFDTYHITAPSYPVIEVLPVERCVFEDINDYDFGLSQIQMTAQGIVTTPAFKQDMRDNTLTYMKGTTWVKSAARLGRIRSKYPDRALVNCEVLL